MENADENSARALAAAAILAAFLDLPMPSYLAHSTSTVQKREQNVSDLSFHIEFVPLQYIPCAV